jgi:hypothetical protein
MGLFFVIIALFFIAKIKKNNGFPPGLQRKSIIYFISLLRNNKLRAYIFSKLFFINRSYKQWAQVFSAEKCIFPYFSCRIQKNNRIFAARF